MNPNCFATSVLAALLFFAGSAIGCQCQSPSLSKSSAYADIILVAKVSDFEPLRHVTLQPTEVIKGRASKSLTILTGLSDCDYFLPPTSPKAGEEYLLFLERSNGRLVVSRCLASGRIAVKAAELQVLRKRFKSNAQPRAAGDTP
jgi:hypothetical protein